MHVIFFILHSLFFYLKHTEVHACYIFHFAQSFFILIQLSMNKDKKKKACIKSVHLILEEDVDFLWLTQNLNYNANNSLSMHP